MLRAFPLVLLPALLVSPNPPSPPSKPVAPIALEATLEGDPAGRFAVAATASSDLGEVEIEVVLPPGMTAEAGPRAAKGPGKAGLKVGARGRGTIFVCATVRRGSARLSRTVAVPVDPPPAARRGVLRRNARGERILEFAP